MLSEKTNQFQKLMFFRVHLYNDLQTSNDKIVEVENRLVVLGLPKGGRGRGGWGERQVGSDNSHKRAS